MRAIMKKLAIMRKPMIAIRSGPRRRAGHSDATDTGRSTRFALQPAREVLLQICCRCSHRQQSMQFMIAHYRQMGSG